MARSIAEVPEAASDSYERKSLPDEEVNVVRMKSEGLAEDTLRAWVAISWLSMQASF